MSSNYSQFYKLVRQRIYYRRLLLSNIISQLGDWLSYISLSFIAMKSGGESLEGVGFAIAGVYLAHSLPNAFAAPLVGPIVDRYSRNVLMLISSLGSALITFIICLNVNEGSLLFLQALICLRVMVSNLGLNARQAALPNLVESSEIYLANALNSSVWSTLFTLGVALGGILSTLLGPQQAILIDTLTYLVSAVVIYTLPTLSPSDSVGSHAQLSTSDSRLNISAPVSTRRDLASDKPLQPTPRLSEAWIYVKQTPHLWVPIFAKVPISFFNGTGWIALNLMALQKFPDSSGLAIGLLTAARGLGMGVGPALLKSKSQSWSPLWAEWLVLAALFSFIFSSNIYFSVAMLFLWGVGNGVNYVISTATIQSYAPTHLLGRLSSLDFLCFTSGQSIATLSAAYLSDHGFSLLIVSGLACLPGLILLLVLMVIERQVPTQCK